MLTLAFAGGPIASAQTTNTATVTRHRYQRHKRTFWQKHRDKLTVAGTGLAGAGSGALYTYKIRKRHRHYRRY